MRETLADLTDFSRFPPLSKVSYIPTNEMVKRTSTHFQDIPGRVSNLLASINSVPADGVDVSDYKYEEESEKAKIEQDNPAISCRLQAARVDQKASRCYNELLEKKEDGTASEQGEEEDLAMHQRKQGIFWHSAV